ncbi:MAG TPA: peroxiredoxin [Bacteroidales bacterium]|nr:peroxiredoxin [Bacteroidales bacterium]
MKQIMITLTMLFFSVWQAWSQQNVIAGYPMLGDNAPSFTAQSTTGKINFPKDYTGSWKIIFSHPADFTPVCSTELLELGEMQDDFNKWGVKLIILSTDKLSTHQQWVQSMETIRYKDKDPVKIDFPLVADEDHVISKKYGMMQPNTNTTKDVRGVYIIDPQDKIRAMFFYPMSVGRNMDEIKRTLIALQTADQHNVLTPANWQPGGDVLLQSTKNPPDQSELAKQTSPDVYQLSWYLTFMKLNK